MNKLYKDFGVYLQTEKNNYYKIKNVVIFKNGEIKIISNYFLDNFKDYIFDFEGEINRKNKIDLQNKEHYVIKAEKQDYYDNNTQYDLYLNGDILDYKFIKLELTGERLEIHYSINNIECNHCIGWNYKKQYEIKYHKYDEIYKKCHMFNIDDSDFENNLKQLNKMYKEYKKIKEIEKNYTEKDYIKMSLSSGTTEEENKIMLRNNGFEV